MPVTAPTPPSPERPDASPARPRRPHGARGRLDLGARHGRDQLERRPADCDRPAARPPPQPARGPGLLRPEARLAIQTALDQAIASGDAWDLELPSSPPPAAASASALPGREGDREPPGGRTNRAPGGQLQDVTPQRRLWAELEGHRQRLRALYSPRPPCSTRSTPMATCSRSVTSGCAITFGWLSRDEVIGRPLAAFMPADSAAALIVRQLPLLWVGRRLQRAGLAAALC